MCLNYSKQTVMYGMENVKKLHYINRYVTSHNFTLAS